MQSQPRLTPQQLNGDLRRGGYILSGVIQGDTDAVLNAGQNWQVRAKSGSGFVDTAARIIFDGHVLALPDNLTVTRYSSTAQVRAGTMDALLASGHLQDIGFTAQATPLNDHQITGMTMADIVQHIFERHCNAWYHSTTMPDGVITVADIDTTNSVPLDRYNVDQSSNLWRSLQQIGGGEKKGEFYNVFFNRANKFFYQPAPAFWVSPPTSLGTIDKTHLRGSIRVRRNANQPSQKVGQVNITAVRDFDTVYTSTYPPHASGPGEGRILPPRDGIFANSQLKTDTLAERLYKWLTRAYTLTIEVDPALILFGDDGNGLDLSDKITLDYDGAAEDAVTGAGLHLNLSGDYFVYGVNVRFDTTKKTATGTLILESDPT